MVAKAARFLENVYEEVDEARFPGTGQKQQRKSKKLILRKEIIFSASKLRMTFFREQISEK